MKNTIANLVLSLVNIVGLGIGLLLSEYELSKLRKPDVSWLPTPVAVDWTLASLIILATVINLAVIAFVFMRGLHHHRRWLWWSTAVVALLIGAVSYTLGSNFGPVIWPTAEY